MYGESNETHTVKIRGKEIQIKVWDIIIGKKI